jgi:hypothetical protein
VTIKKNIIVQGWGCITYPTVLADRLIEHTWSDTSSSARYHLNIYERELTRKNGRGGGIFYLADHWVV